jgi:hypothetical protein
LCGFVPLLISSPQNPQKQSASRDAFAMYCPRPERESDNANSIEFIVRIKLDRIRIRGQQLEVWMG